MEKIITEKEVMKNGVRLDMTTLRISPEEWDAGVVEGEKLRIRSDNWRTIKAAVIIRATELILDGRVPRTWSIWRVIQRAAEERLDNPRIFSQLNQMAMSSMCWSVEQSVHKGVKSMAGRRSGITVTTTEGEVLAAPAPGIAAINMGDENGHSAFDGRGLEAEAARAGVEIVKNVPKALPFCECGCGEQTRGGKFLPGHDAKLKSRLIEQYRSDDPEERREAYDELLQRGWEHFATIIPKKRKRQGDGLGEGSYTITDEEGKLLQRVADDDTALTWAEEHGYELVGSQASGITVAASDPDDDDEDDDDEEE